MVVFFFCLKLFVLQSIMIAFIVKNSFKEKKGEKKEERNENLGIAVFFNIMRTRTGNNLLAWPGLAFKAL